VAGRRVQETTTSTRALPYHPLQIIGPRLCTMHALRLIFPSTPSADRHPSSRRARVLRQILVIMPANPSSHQTRRGACKITVGVGREDSVGARTYQKRLTQKRRGMKRSAGKNSGEG